MNCSPIDLYSTYPKYPTFSQVKDAKDTGRLDKIKEGLTGPTTDKVCRVIEALVNQGNFILITIKSPLISIDG